MSINDIYEQYYEYVKTHPSSLVDLDTVMFEDFVVSIRLPFSLYQKINHRKLSNYVKKRLMTMYTSLPEEYLEDAKRYYEEHVDAVNNAKAVIKGKYKRMLTLDEVAEAYLEYCKTLGLTSMWKITHIQGSLNNYDRVDYFSEFMNSFDTMIPFSLYQKINEEKLTKWVDAYLRKVKDE
jgi:hypothetical protein